MFKFIGIVLAVFYVGLWLLMVLCPLDDIEMARTFLAVLYG